MIKVKRIIEKQAEEDLVNMVLEQAIDHNMTIQNIKEVTNKVIEYMELNAILVMEDSNNSNNTYTYPGSVALTNK